jgi:hypothetical protein
MAPDQPIVRSSVVRLVVADLKRFKLVSSFILHVSLRPFSSIELMCLSLFFVPLVLHMRTNFSRCSPIFFLSSATATSLLHSAD